MQRSQYVGKKEKLANLETSGQPEGYGEAEAALEPPKQAVQGRGCLGPGRRGPQASPGPLRRSRVST